MKRILLLAVIIMIGVLQLQAQQSGESEIKNELSPLHSHMDQALYVIRAANGEIKVGSAQSADSIRSKAVFRQFSPDWIQSMTVLRGDDAVEKYGAKGQHGVIVIDLKPGMLEKMSDELRKQFRAN